MCSHNKEGIASSKWYKGQITSEIVMEKRVNGVVWVHKRKNQKRWGQTTTKYSQKDLKNAVLVREASNCVLYCAMILEDVEKWMKKKTRRGCKLGGVCEVMRMCAFMFRRDDYNSIFNIRVWSNAHSSRHLSQPPNTNIQKHNKPMPTSPHKQTSKQIQTHKRTHA